MIKKYYISLDKDLVDTYGFEETLFMYYLRQLRRNGDEYINFSYKNLFEKAREDCGFTFFKWRQAEIIEKLLNLSVIYVVDRKGKLMIKMVEEGSKSKLTTIMSIEGDELEQRIKNFAGDFRRLHKENYPSLPVPLQGGIRPKEKAQIVNILKFLDKCKENSLVFLTFCFTNRNVQPPSGSPSIGWIAYGGNQMKFLKFKGKNGDTSKSNTFSAEEEQILAGASTKF
jgi:hypothetical protein